MIVLGAGNFAAAETAVAAALDALGAGTHGATHGVLHRTAVRDTLFELLGNVLSDELSVHIRGTDLNNVELDGLADEGSDLSAELFDLGAIFADDHTGACAVNEQGNNVVAALDFDLGNAGTVEGLLDELADLVVFDDQIADFFISGIPTGVPVFDDAYAHAVGINFLSHKTVSSLLVFLRDGERHMRSSFVDAIASALGGGDHALEDGTAGGIHFGDVQLGGVHAEVVLGVCNGALEELDQGLGCGLGGLHQNGHGGVDVLTADQVADDLHLAGRDADISQISFSFHILHPP